MNTSKLFDEMFILAKNILSEKEKSEQSQAVVILSSKGNKYGIFIKDALSFEKKDEKNLIKVMMEENDTNIDSILCVWHNGEVDVPSCGLRKMFEELNPLNKNAKIFVLTENGYVAKKLI